MPPIRDFREVLARLQAYRRKFEGLLASARKNAVRDRVAPARPPTRLRELPEFGANPGNLRMFVYAAEQLPPSRPLVVALHGCSQTADEFDYGTGWSSLAERSRPRPPVTSEPRRGSSVWPPGRAATETLR